MTRTFLILLLIAAPVRATDHGASRDEDPVGKKVPLTGSAPGTLQENSAPPAAKGGGKGDKDKAAAKSGDKTNPVRVTGYPLFIVADDGGEGAKLDDQLLVLAKRKVPGARTLLIRPLTLEKLQTAWAEARQKDLDGTSLVSNAMLIVNARAGTGEGVTLLTPKGAVAEPRWRAAVGDLSRSVFGEPVPGKNKLETILLVSSAGGIDCRRFPGPVFGMSVASQARRLPALQVFVQRLAERGDEPFPLGAREWFDGWAITRKAGGEDYFFCPAANGKGFLGYKDTPDPNGPAKYRWMESGQ